jgi:hypothetical protein
MPRHPVVKGDRAALDRHSKPGATKSWILRSGDIPRTIAAASA